MDQEPDIGLAQSLSQVSDQGVSGSCSLVKTWLRQDRLPGSFSGWQDSVPYGLLNWEPEYITGCWTKAMWIVPQRSSQHGSLLYASEQEREWGGSSNKEVKVLWLHLRSDILSFGPLSLCILLFGSHSLDSAHPQRKGLHKGRDHWEAC